MCPHQTREHVPLGISTRNGGAVDRRNPDSYRRPLDGIANRRVRTVGDYVNAQLPINSEPIACWSDEQYMCNRKIDYHRNMRKEPSHTALENNYDNSIFVCAEGMVHALACSVSVVTISSGQSLKLLYILLLCCFRTDVRAIFNVSRRVHAVCWG